MPSVLNSGLIRNIGTTPVTVYTAPSGTKVLVIGMTLTNKTSSDVKVGVALRSSTNDFYLLGGDTPSTNGASLASGQRAVITQGQRIVLNAGDSLRVVSSVTNSVDCVVSVLEVS